MGGSDERAYRNDENRKARGPKLAVCLVSGGMDSCVTAAIANEEHTRLAFLHVSYGQLTEQRELRAFSEIANHYQVDQRLAVSSEHLSRIGGSSLTDRNMAVAKADLDAAGIPTSYVPFRNAHLLSIASRPEFYQAFQVVIDRGTKPETTIQIRTPVIAMKKAEIVLRGQELGAPLHLTWSCYQESERACGQCDSCALRLRAFRAAGIPDPIPYLLDSKRFAY